MRYFKRYVRSFWGSDVMSLIHIKRYLFGWDEPIPPKEGDPVVRYEHKSKDGDLLGEGFGFHEEGIFSGKPDPLLDRATFPIPISKGSTDDLMLNWNIEFRDSIHHKGVLEPYVKTLRNGIHRVTEPLGWFLYELAGRLNPDVYEY